MDVTFFENQPFYPKTPIQGENSITQEYQFWEKQNSESNPSLGPIITEPIPEYVPTVEPIPDSVQNTQPVISLVPTLSANDKELRVYTRRQKSREEMELRTLPEQLRESDPSSINSDLSPGNTIPETPSNDLDIPIAVRKCVRTCTQHPICNFASYKGLSLNYHAFVTNLSNIEIPNSIQEALKNPEWKAAIKG